MEYTSLGLGGVPRAGVLYDDTVQGDERPDSGQFTELGLSGAARSPQQFDAKAPGEIPPRPDGAYTELGLTGLPGPIATYTPKRSTIGIYGSVDFSITPQAAISVGRRRYVITDIVTSLRPLGTVTFAHTNRVLGSVSLTLSPQATTMRYHRFGSANAIQGNSSVLVVPFGFGKHRTWRLHAGSTVVSVTPQAGLRYTVAPVRNLRVNGRAIARFIPQGLTAYTELGEAYGVAGSTNFQVVPNGSVSIVRQTTYITYGRTTVTYTPQASITKTTGLPVAYSVAGSTAIQVIPQGSMGLKLGITEQHFIVGDVSFSVLPVARLRIRRPSAIPPLVPGERRRLIRIFRRSRR